MLKEILERTIVESLPPLRKSPKGWITCNCPLCVHRGHRPDKRKRFGIKIEGDKIGINCFNCGFHSQWVTKTLISKQFAWFLETIGLSKTEIQKLKFQAFREKEDYETFAETPTKLLDFDRVWKESSLPVAARSFTWHANNGEKSENFVNVVKYAQSRGLDDYDNLYWVNLTEKDMNKRVIIPFMYNNRIVGYSARYYGTPPKKTIPRFITSSPTSFLYNFWAHQYNFDGKIVIVHEGLIDAYLTHGISTLGPINEDKINSINMLRDQGKRIIVSPDRDPAGMSLVTVAAEQDWEVSFPPWCPDIKDAGQACQRYGKVLTVQSIIAHAAYGKTKILLNRKMDKFIKT